MTKWLDHLCDHQRTGWVGGGELGGGAGEAAAPLLEKKIVSFRQN